MKNIRLFVAALTLILLATSASYAGTISEDVYYWFRTVDGGSDSQRNPTDEWLKLNVSNLLVKVQQTVYDQESTLAILNRNNAGEGTQNSGFLYAYALTNLNVGDPADFADMGITSFHVDWATPYYATVSSRQTPVGWVVDTTSNAASSGPTWKWTPVDPGLLPGETVGGFWAVSNVGVDGECNAGIIHGGPFGPSGWSGKTTGPMAPEPGAFVSLFAGLAGLGLTVRLRKRK